MEGGCAALATTTEQFLSGPHPEPPLDRPTEQQTTTDTLTDEDAGERMRQAKNPPSTKLPSRRIFTLIHERVGPLR